MSHRFGWSLLVEAVAFCAVSARLSRVGQTADSVDQAIGLLARTSHPVQSVQSVVKAR
jgi:hypothetical protein